MTAYDTMQVCSNGHVITTHYSDPSYRQDRCSTCGAKTQTQCEHCGQRIKGAAIDGFYFPDTPPEYCEKCGEPFPWKGRLASEDAQGPLERVLVLCRRFPSVAKQLAKRHSNRAAMTISDEYDVQDLMHALLRIDFDDVRPEETTPSHAGKSARMDFLLKREKIVLETKMSRPSLTHKEVGDELIIDIDRYKEHPDCEHLVCLIFDPAGHISNPIGLEEDLARSSGKPLVTVVVAPKH